MLSVKKQKEEKKIYMKLETYYHMKVISAYTLYQICLKHDCLKDLKVHDHTKQKAFLIQINIISACTCK